MEEGVLRPNNVDVVETKNAKFSIIRSRHDVPNTTEEVGEAEIFCLEVPFVDFGHGFLDKENLELNFLTRIDLSIQFSQLKECYQIEHLYIVDFFEIFKNKTLLNKIIKEVGSTRRNFLFSLGISLWGLKELYSRDRFDKVIGAGEITVGAYLAKSSIAFKLICLGYKGKFLELIEETDFLLSLTIRNLIIAHKASFVAEIHKKENDTKPEIAIAVGAAHGLVTESLKYSDNERKKLFKKLLNTAVERKIINEEERELLDISFCFLPYLNLKTSESKMFNI